MTRTAAVRTPGEDAPSADNARPPATAMTGAAESAAAPAQKETLEQRFDRMEAENKALREKVGMLTDIARATEIILRWTTPEGAIAAQKLVGFRAICAQHEMDHLDGILTLDHLSPEARAKAEAEASA